MNHVPLFAGINGFGLAAEWMGWKQPFHCEIDSFCQRIIKYYWPNSKPYYDIRETDFTIHRGQVDILTGGFPCQPYSQAGKRLGKEDDRHLWPEMLRAIREIQPRWVVGENVSGLTNWNGGLVFDEVQTDLENEGYEVTPYLLPACAVNAPHKRERVWFIAHTESNTCRHGNRNERQKPQEIPKKRFNESIASTDTKSERPRGIPNKEKETGTRKGDELFGGEYRIQNNDGNVTNSDSFGLRNKADGIGKTGFINQEGPGNYWKDFPTQSPICNGDDGLSSRLDGITFPKWRNESIKGGGNAIVPHVAYHIFKAIEAYEKFR